MANERGDEPLVGAPRQSHPHDIDVLGARHASATHKLRCEPERALQGRHFVTTAVNDHNRARSTAPELRDLCRQRGIALRATANLDDPCRAVHAGSPDPSLRPSMRFAFCTACPAAPFTRLSIADITTRTGRRVPASGSAEMRT